MTNTEIRTLALFYKGISWMMVDNFMEAIRCFNAVLDEPLDEGREVLEPEEDPINF